MKRRLVLMIACIAVLAIASVVLAKQEPYVEEPGVDFSSVDSPVVIPDSVAAFVLAGRFDAADDVDAFTHTVTAEGIEDIGSIISTLPTPTPVPTVEGVMTLPIDVIVPICGEHFQTVYPTVAVIGPGLDVPEEELPFELPEGMGAVLLSQEQSEVRSGRDVGNYSEVITYPPQEFNVDLTVEGVYTLAVWEPSGQLGAYMISVAGNVHSMDDARPMRERDHAFFLLTNGGWMDTDCDADEFAFNTPIVTSEEG